MFNIALNTFREIIRNKFFSLIAFLGIVFVLLSLIIDTLALGEARRVLIDFGLSFIELTGVAIILFLGGGMIAREIEGRTIYLMLSKPIPRGSIILGKFLGFALILLISLIIESIVLVVILAVKDYTPDAVFLMAILATYLKHLALLALILFFSTFVSPILALFVTLASYIIGHSGYAILEYAGLESSAITGFFAQVVLVLFPNLESLNIKNYVATGATIDLEMYGISFLIAIGYIIIILFLAKKLFEHKSFDAV
jgi:ABC-type transport system involved in multi-copper enzyme maturation permease subunit